MQQSLPRCICICNKNLKIIDKIFATGKIFCRCLEGNLSIHGNIHFDTLLLLLCSGCLRLLSEGI